MERFKHALVVRNVTTSVAHLRICASAPSLFASVSVFEVLGCGESPCRSQWDFDGHVVFLPTTVLNASHSFFVLSLVTRTKTPCRISKQSPMCSRGGGSSHSMDPGVSVQKQNFTRNPEKLAKVPGTREEA